VEVEGSAEGEEITMVTLLIVAEYDARLRPHHELPIGMYPWVRYIARRCGNTETRAMEGNGRWAP
jgi:hypothetical protein